MNEKAEPTDQSDRLGVALDAFVEEYRLGKRPSINEYAERFPDVADRLRELIPLLAVMEQAGSSVEASEGTNAITPSVSSHIQQAIEEQAGYKILRPIGKGGMGIVYEAIQLTLGRHVALKVLPAETSQDPARMKRFEFEAKAAAQLHHTHIVPVFEVGKAGGVGFYAMQFILGQSLDRVLTEIRELRDQKSSQSTKASRAANPLTRQLATEILDRRISSSQEPASINPEESFPHTATSSATNADSYAKLSFDRPECTPSSANMADTEPALQWQDTDKFSPNGAPSSVSEATQSVHQTYHRSVASIGVQAAEALAYAHSKGVLHRDVKPANLLLDTQGQIWLTDFGLAKTRDHDLTTDGDVVGTLRYLPPERLQGHADARSDVYSLGLTLWELLALKPAFDATDQAQLLQQVSDGNCPPLRQIDTSIPRDLETIVRKAIEPLPENRYSNSQELADDLQRFLENRPIRARRTAFIERGWRWCQRQPAIAGLIAAVGLVAVVGAIGITYQWREAVDQSNLASIREKQAKKSSLVAMEQRDRATEANQTLTETLRRLRRVTYAAQVNLAMNDWNQGAFDRIPQLLAQQIPAEGEEDLRGFEWYLLRELSEACKLTVDQFEGPISAISIDPQGETFAAVCLDRSVSIWDVNTVSRKKVLKLDFAGNFYDVAYDPLGRYLATTDDSGAVRLWSTDDYELVAVLDHHARQCTGISFSPDGRYLASMQRGNNSPGEVKVRDLDLDEIVFHHPSSYGAGDSIKFSHDGQHFIWVDHEGHIQRTQSTDWNAAIKVPFDRPVYGVAPLLDDKVVVVGRDRQVVVMNFLTGDVDYATRSAAGFPFAIAISDDQDLLSIASSEVELWDLRSGNLITSFPQQESRALAFLPGSHTLSIGSGNRTVRFWNTDKRSSIRLQPVTARSAPSLEFLSENEIWVAESRANVNRVQLDSGEVSKAIDAEFNLYNGISVSRSSNRLAFSTLPGEVQLWSLKDAKQLGSVRFGSSPGARSVVNAMSISESGGQLVAIFDNNRLGVWDIEDPENPKSLLLQTIPESIASCVTQSPDGRYIAAGLRNGEVLVFDANKKFDVQTVPNHQAAVAALAFDDDSETLAVATMNRSLSLWSLERNDLMGRLTTHAQPIAAMSFQPNSNRLATLGREGAIKIFSDRRLEELMTLQVSDRVGLDLKFSPSGKTLATSWSDGTVRWWRIEKNEPDDGFSR